MGSVVSDSGPLFLRLSWERKTVSRSTRRAAIVFLGLALIAAYLVINRDSFMGSGIPVGIARANGRIESIQVDVSAKEPGRVLEILVKEGDMVQPGQIVARMDTISLEAERARALAHVSEQEAAATEVQSAIIRAESKVKLARIEQNRAKTLLAQNAGTREEYDQKEAEVRNTEATLEEHKARLGTVKQTILAAKAEVAYIESRLRDYVLKSPVRGRVLYRLSEPGEILPSGGKVLTVVNLGDVYMEIFLPSREAARVKTGAEARIILDAAPKYAARARVSFVAPEAQFTPKQVETSSERDKLMFRVKLSLPPELVEPFIDRIKTGIRGVGYVRLDDSVEWPAMLNVPFPRPERELPRSNGEEKKDRPSSGNGANP